MYDYTFRNNLPMFYDFYIVAKEGSYSKAAEKTLTSKSNFHRTIKALEESLNLQLFTKTNKGVKLTLDGEKLYKELDEMFNKKVFNVEAKDQELTGTIKIGTTRNISDYKLEKYLTDFIEKYPNVEIKILTDNASNLNKYLVNREIDILIDYLLHINYSEKFELDVKAIGNFDTCFACSKMFYEKNKNSINKLEDLKNYKLVIPGSSRRRQMLDEVLQSNNVELKPNIEMPDSKLMIDFINNNDFIGYFIEEELKNTDLVKISLKEQMPVNSIGMIYHKKTINSLAKRFVELVVSEI